MKVYEFKGFPNPARVRLALAEKGLLDEVEFIQVDVPNGEHRRPEFLDINPSGAVPALVLDDGTAISESAAITEYIDHLTGETVLTGRSAKERGVIHMLQRKVEDGLLDAVSAYFHHATPGLGPDLETYQNAEWGEKRKEVAIATMHWMDNILGQNNFLAGDRLTIADITGFAGLAFAGFAEISIPDDCENLKNWHQNLLSRPTMEVLT